MHYEAGGWKDFHNLRGKWQNWTTTLTCIPLFLFLLHNIFYVVNTETPSLSELPDSLWSMQTVQKEPGGKAIEGGGALLHNESMQGGQK